MHSFPPVAEEHLLFDARAARAAFSRAHEGQVLHDQLAGLQSCPPRSPHSPAAGLGLYLAAAKDAGAAHSLRSKCASARAEQQLDGRVYAA